MHECFHGSVCDCDGEDMWNDMPDDCDCECEDDESDDYDESDDELWQDR